MIRITGRLVLPEQELRFSTSTSGGPGGQHANKTETRVEVRWDIEASGVLDGPRRDKLRKRLSHHMVGDDVVVSSQEHRSQHRNKQEAIDKLVHLLQDALRPRKARKATRPTRGSKRRRLKNKRHRGKIKDLRGKVRRED
jgi:ribosome-associated protein